MNKLGGWLWSLLEFTLSVVALFASYRLVVWAMAKPASELPTHVVLSSKCLAFRFDHGQYICEPLGTTQSKPILVTVFLIAVVTCFAAATWIHHSGRSERKSLLHRLVDVLRGWASKS